MNKLLEPTYATLLAVPGVIAAGAQLGLGRTEISIILAVTTLATVFLGRYLNKGASTEPKP